MGNEITAPVNLFFQTFGGNHDTEAAGEAFSEDAIIYNDAAMPGALNLETYKKLGEEFLHGFPDLKVTIEQQIAAGDTVATRVIWSGTHTGTFNGIPPTGKSFSAMGMTMDRVENGKIVERHNLGDLLGMMGQLGLLPS